MATETDSTSPGDVQLRADIDRSLRHPVMFFFTSGAAWLAVALVLGLISSVKTFSPEFLDGCPWVSAGRIYAAHLNVLVYGWGCQAAFGVIIWLMARLSRKECRNAGTILTAGHLWNFGVSIGVLGVLGGMGTGMPWMEFPVAVWPVLMLSYIFILVWSVIQFRCREGGHVYISQWYLLGAIFWFPWVFITSTFLIFAFDGHPVMDAAINAWFKGTLIFLFFVPVGMAATYYLAPKVTGRPVYSYNLALFGFWSLAIIGPWAGMQKLAGAPLPQFLPYFGAAATILFFIPAITVGVNILKTVAGHGDTVQESPTLRFAISGTIGLIILGVLGVVLNWTPLLRQMQFSMTGYGYEILAMYGFFSMCAFATIYFVVPRITRREWLSSRFIRWHYYLSLYGVITIVLCSVFGGLSQGPVLEAWDESWKSAITLSSAWGVGIAIAWSFLLISNVFFFLHLLLMWARLGRRSQHPTLLHKPHAVPRTHGADGDLDKPQAANA